MICGLLFLLAVPGALLQEECHGSSCNPQLGDLMVGRAAQLSASSTCGLDGPQNYCILGYLEEEQKCFTCDSRQPYDRHSNPDSHLIENAITIFDPERRMRWWQSEPGVNQVSIQLNLETLFQFSHLVLTFKSFRPAAMLVERSKDFGHTWKVFRYYAEDCAAHFPWVSAEPSDSVDDVVCDSRYSGSQPSTDGEVVLKALDPIFDIEDPYAPNIQELITLTNIRVNFSRLFTLGDTLLGRRRRNPQDKYYYALYDMVVRGSCFCHGHASRCRPVDAGRGDVFNEPGMVHGRCVCQHNTAGDNCERCEDLYNDAPWRPGSDDEPHTCRRCNCHGHSEQCRFDPARYEATGRLSGGVCVDCRNERVGPRCEQCRPYQYQDPFKALEDPRGCIPCDCDPVGSQGGGLCESATGQCVCKENVEGQRCDRCKYGFYGLREDDPAGCQMCLCNSQGTMPSAHQCDQVTGECMCEPLATGRYCDECLPGYWGLGNTVHRCSPCDCDSGGAVGSSCSAEDGKCECLPNMAGRRCNDPAHGYFLPPLDYFLYEAEFAGPLQAISSSSLVNPSALPKCEKYFREQGYDFKYSNGRLVLVRKTKRQARRRRQGEQRTISLEPGSPLQIVPRQRTADRQVTWTGPGFVRVRDGAGLRFTVDNLPSSLDYQLVVRYESESPDDWLASISVVPLSPGDGVCPSDPTESKTLRLPGNSRSAIVDQPVCLNAGGRYFVDITFRKEQTSNPQFSSHILIDSMGLIPRIESVQDLCSRSDLDSYRRFRCIHLAAQAGQQEQWPEVCEELVKSLSARINGAVACRCNIHGSVGQSCSKVGGLCECKPNVIGRCCETCAPLTFGFGPGGCEPCACDQRGALSELCDQVRGQCPCRAEVAGRSCDRCRPGYWGFPLCRPCECNGLAELCDQDTGSCLQCRENSAGHSCERCVEGYHGDPVSREPCEPCSCPDILGSGKFFASFCNREPESGSLICNCLQGHTGPRCDSCSAGFYGDLAAPGALCEQCLCNNNIDPEDSAACDRVTGECLRCLHHTQGAHCQECRPGYYGDALEHSCKECSCDRRGTEVTKCPLGSPCFCQPQSGQCPCRPGATGALCDECADGFWNIGGASGCQPCNCDPANSLDNVCNKVTGQCVCRPEFGGRQCDECGENHFGNPDLQCLSCDCDLGGSERPACDPDTGECLCRVGVTGIFCDECAPGFQQTFPACAPCHACNEIWRLNVSEVQKASQKMKVLIPRQGNQSGHERQSQRMTKMESSLDRLANLTGGSPAVLGDVERLWLNVRQLKDSIDPNLILVNTTPLLNTEIDNIRKDFNNLLQRLRDQNPDDPDVDTEEVEELLDEIRKLHKDFMAEEKKVHDANAAVEDSMNTRQALKGLGANCGAKGNLSQLVDKVNALDVVTLNEKICGAPGHRECAQSKCGGALCSTFWGTKLCGGPSCNGSLPLSLDAKKKAAEAETAIGTLKDQLEASRRKTNATKKVALETLDLSDKLQDRINNKKEDVEREKQKAKDLLRLVQVYLRDEMVSPDDIEKMAQAVLNIQLPGTPDQIRSLIKDIKDLVSNTPDLKKDLSWLEEQTKIAQDLLQQALQLKDKSKNIDVTHITEALYAAERAQDTANNDLEDATNATDMIKDQITNVQQKLDDAEGALMSGRPPGELLGEIGALKNKTDLNREQALEAGRAADDALSTAGEAEAELDKVNKKFKELKEKNGKQNATDMASQLLKDITMEAEKLKEDVKRKLKQIEDLESRIQDSISSKNQKAKEVEDLLDAAEELRHNITQKAMGYIDC
ncbi:laminin subunit beta-4 [Gadus chalcogrammus]|uniref:laminin subunit beta-4 n=1 Tax=Gadus chalcogrammus TaxID=1042646 RepID=UPI0024C4CCDB|nr:laminin subunit beta-4 [Gadus chalcogrammus]